MAPPSIIVLFGGTFNPVHEGHLGLIQGLITRGDVEQLMVIPTARNPFKKQPPLLPVALRLEMLRAAVREIPRVAVLDLELRRPQPSYTIDTVTTLAAQYPESSLRLALGWDVFTEFGRWRDVDGILERAGLWVVMRKGSPQPEQAGLEEVIARFPAPLREQLALAGDGGSLNRGGVRVAEFFDLGLPEVSATTIRATHSTAQVPPGAREILASYWRTQPAKP